MINQQLLTYISSQQEAGVDDDTIKDNLLSAGWRQEDVDEGFQAVADDGSGDNSPQNHQDIRKDAAQRRAGYEPSDDDEVDDIDEDTDAGSDDDSYREPIEDEGEGAMQSKDSPGLSPIDETAGSNSTANSRQLPENEEENDDSESTPDESVGSDTTQSDIDTESSGSDDAKKMTDDDQVAKNPLDSHEEMKKIGRQESADHDPSPVAMRTFARDSEQLDKGKKKAGKMDRPEEQPVKAQAVQNDEVKEKSAENKFSTTAGAGGVKFEAPAELAKDIKDTETSDDSSGDDKKMPEQTVSGSPQKRPRMETVSDIKSAGPETSRAASDGKRRFTAAQKSAAMKKEASKQKKTSSGSNWVSILIFVFALVLVGGGGAYAYMTFFQTYTPETNADEVMAALTEAGSFDFRLMIESAASDGLPDRNLVIEGGIDLDTDNDVQSYYTITSRGTPIQSVMAEVENMPTVPAIQRDTIRDILLTPEFLSIGAYQTEERLGQSGGRDGFATNRYGISVDPERIVSDYATLHQALFGDALLQDVLSSLQETVAGFQPTQGQAWLHPDTNLPFQITVLGTGSAGQDMQINIQLKNHGVAQSSSPSYQPRSIEQSLQTLFFPDSDQDQLDDTDDVITDDESDDDTATTTDTTDDESIDPGFSAAEMEQFDRLRINDIQQLQVALRMYQREKGTYPTNLNQLISADSVSMSQLPRDPVPDRNYIYSVSGSSDQYHLGATLQVLTRSDVSNDANFNSAAQGFLNGFDGAGQSCKSTEQDMQVSTCYDVTRSTD